MERTDSTYVSVSNIRQERGFDVADFTKGNGRVVLALPVVLTWRGILTAVGFVGTGGRNAS